METVADFIFWGSKITADGDCSHEIKRHLLLGRKIMTNLDSIIFKIRDNTLPIKVCVVKAMVFPVVMCGCKSWTIKRAEGRRIDAFELWCWRKLESPLDCKGIQPFHLKANQSWIFIGRTDAEGETLILWPPDAKNWFIWKNPDPWCWERLKAGREEDDRGWHGWMASPTQWTWGLSKFQKLVMDREAWHAWVTKSQTRLSDWTKLNWPQY